MAIQPNQDNTDEFSTIGPDATAGFEPASRASDPTEHASSEHLETVGRKSGLDEEDEVEDEDDDLVDDDEDNLEDDDLEDDDEDDDLEDEDDDLEDDDEDDDEEDDEEEEEDDEVKPLKV